MDIDDLRTAIANIQSSCDDALAKLNAVARDYPRHTRERNPDAAFSDEFVTDLAVKIARRVADLMEPTIPLGVALWDLRTISTYLHRSEQHTRQWIVTQGGFPHPLRIPSNKGSTERPRPLWRAKDIILWAEEHVET